MKSEINRNQLIKEFDSVASSITPFPAPDDGPIDEFFLNNPSFFKEFFPEKTEDSSNNRKNNSGLLNDHAATLLYQTRDFTRKIEFMLQILSICSAIPKEFKTNLALDQVLCSISKMFMLSEFEITFLACAFDHFSWKVNDFLAFEKRAILIEFPCNFGILNEDSKRLIIYLLLITFHVKHSISEKEEVNRIQAYCEKICIDFSGLYNRWMANFSNSNFLKISLKETNKKFKWFNFQVITPDYNRIVDEIITLQGCSLNAKKTEKKKAKRAKKANLQNKKNKKNQELFDDELLRDLRKNAGALAKQSSSRSFDSYLTSLKLVFNPMKKATKKVKTEKGFVGEMSLSDFDEGSYPEKYSNSEDFTLDSSVDFN